MATITEHNLPEVKVLSREEGWEFLEEQSQKRLGMSAEEFIKAWDGGEFDGEQENIGAEYVGMLLPFVR